MPTLIRLILALAVWAASPAAAQEFGRPVAQVALQPLPDTDTLDIEQLVRAHWRAYFNAGGPHGFFRDNIRAGRIDLNEDGRAELFVLIDAPAWKSEKGLPFVVAQWTSKGWVELGGDWADPDGVFVTASRVQGWATIETSTQWLRWNGASYRPINKSKP